MTTTATTATTTATTVIEAKPARGVGGSPSSETFTGESLVRDGEILARGVPIGELIGGMSYTEMLFFQLQARRASEVERVMLEAYLVSLCEHGVTSPSTHGPRVCASVGSPFAASAIGFIAGAMGPFHFGALQAAMEELRGLDASGETCEEFVARRVASGERVWGYGHRFHKSAATPDPVGGVQEDADPRVRRLIGLADELGWDGVNLARVRKIGRLLFACKGVPINIDGVAAGLLLDMGFEPEVALLFVMIGRLPNIARLHLEERGQTPNRFTALATGRDPGFDRTVARD